MNQGHTLLEKSQKYNASTIPGASAVKPFTLVMYTRNLSP